MPSFLARRFAGLPAWAWVAILAGGLTIGLILRSRMESDEGDVAADEEPLDEYPEEYAAMEDYPAEGYGPNAIDTLGTGGYVNYPIQPIQPGINVTIGGPQPCDEKTKPKQKPPKGYQWVCPNGNWQLAPLGGRPGGGGGGGRGCGQKPRGGCGGKNRHWKCQGGRWKCVGGGGRGDGHGGGRDNARKVRTGGGPPAARKNHEPIGGRLPKGQSTDQRTTWVPGNPSLIIPTG